MLSDAANRVGDQDWVADVAPAFLRVFGDRPVAEAVAAFRALYASGRIHPVRLEVIPAKLFTTGDPAAAFALQSQLQPVPNSLGSLELPIIAYRYLEAAEGREAALDWLDGRLPPSIRTAAAAVMYDAGEFELLWELVDDPGSGEAADFAWLMRAAASVRLEPDDPHRDELIEYYRRERPGDYHTMGRYLLGLAGESSVLALATTRKRRCEIAYYMGLRAEAEGRTRDAYAWYHVVLETGSSSDGEYRWALAALQSAPAGGGFTDEAAGGGDD